MSSSFNEVLSTNLKFFLKETLADSIFHDQDLSYARSTLISDKEKRHSMRVFDVDLVNTFQAINDSVGNHLCRRRQKFNISISCQCENVDLNSDPFLDMILLMKIIHLTID